MTRSRFRLPAIAGLAVASLAALAGCATGTTPTASGGPVSITFSSYSYGTQGAAGEGVQQLLDRFAELNPDITVVAENVPTADVLTKTTAAVASGTAPDVVQMGYSKLAQALSTLPVASLEDIAGEEWAGYAEGLVQGPLTTGTSEGTVKAVPFTISVPTLFYNADLFRAAGLNPDRPPATIAEVRQAAQAIVDSGKLGAYFAIADSAKSDYLTQSVIDSAGGATVDADGNVTFDQKVAVDAISKVQQLTLDGLQPAVAPEDALAAFSAGNLGMMVVSTAVLGTVQAATQGVFDLRTGAFPSFGPGAPTHSGASLMVLSQDAAKQAAAWKLVSFLTGDEGAAIITSTIGYLPIRPALVDGALASYFADNPLLLPTVNAMQDMSPYLSFAGADANQATVMLQDEAIAPIVLRGADAASTLKDVGDRIRQLTSVG